MASYLEPTAKQRRNEPGGCGSSNGPRRSSSSWQSLGFVLYSVLQNHSEERQIQAFLDRLKAKDYQGAYRMWGCTEATPCRDYSLQRFMDDWGPASPHGDAAHAQVGGGDSCGTGVVVPVDFKKGEHVPLWVERRQQNHRILTRPRVPQTALALQRILPFSIQQIVISSVQSLASGRPYFPG